MKRQYNFAFWHTLLEQQDRQPWLGEVLFDVDFVANAGMDKTLDTAPPYPLP
jgi:hypothetical protein